MLAQQTDLAWQKIPALSTTIFIAGVIRIRLNIVLSESSPQPANIETRFGKYSNTAKLVGNKILYYRTQEQYSGTFPPKDYADLVKYYDSIYKADRSKIVLIKKETN